MEDSFIPSVNLFTLLRPILRINHIIGTCPCVKDGKAYTIKWYSRPAIHTLLVLTGLIVYFVSLLVQMYCIVRAEDDRVNKVTKTVAVSSWVYSTFTPIIIILFKFQKRFKYNGFFERIEEYREPLANIIDPINTVQLARRITSVYIGICISVCCIVISVAWNCPRSEGMVMYFYPGKEEPPLHWIIIGCIVQCYLVLAQYSASAIIEVICGIMTISMERAVVVLQNNLVKACEPHMTSLELEEKPTYENNMGLPSIDIDASVNHVLFQRSMKTTSLTIPYQSLSLGFREKNPIGAMVKSIKSFSCIVGMQNLISGTFGSQLALNTALHVFLTCCYFFLLLTNYNPTLASSDDSSLQKPNYYSYLILWNSTCILTRLLTVFMSFGNFHHASLGFTASLSEQFINNQLKDEDNSGIFVESEKRAKYIQLISTFLVSQQSNPCCISAGGYFVFSRSTLVAAFSIIITYVIFLVQVK
ncbi:unnamed protein product [Allacma fusca]|uniref:Gustatory receptor n=1 Tax=Allacma fusca TaxID=39272 RepID=A0A8J2LFN1_9HEXA|nr:unnamed protein product [Allacma fusca]